MADSTWRKTSWSQESLFWQNCIFIFIIRLPLHLLKWRCVHLYVSSYSYRWLRCDEIKRPPSDLRLVHTLSKQLHWKRIKLQLTQLQRDAFFYVPKERSTLSELYVQKHIAGTLKRVCLHTHNAAQLPCQRNGLAFKVTCPTPKTQTGVAHLQSFSGQPWFRLTTSDFMGKGSTTWLCHAISDSGWGHLFLLLSPIGEHMAHGEAEVLPPACIADLTAMSVDINRPSVWTCLVHNVLFRFWNDEKRCQRSIWKSFLLPWSIQEIQTSQASFGQKSFSSVILEKNP